MGRRPAGVVVLSRDIFSWIGGWGEVVLLDKTGSEDGCVCHSDGLRVIAKLYRIGLGAELSRAYHSKCAEVICVYERAYPRTSLHRSGKHRHRESGINT